MGLRKGWVWAELSAGPIGARCIIQGQIQMIQHKDLELISHHYLLLFQGLNVTLGWGLAAVAVSPHSSIRRAVDWAQCSIPASISGCETTPWGRHYGSLTTGEVNIFSVVSVKCYIRFVWNAIYPGINPIRSFWFMKMYKTWHVQENITARILEIDLSFESNDIRFIFINWVKSLGWNHTITARNCKQAIRSQECVSLF